MTGHSGIEVPGELTSDHANAPDSGGTRDEASVQSRQIGQEKAPAGKGSREKAPGAFVLSEAEAWEKVDSLNKQSLRDFLKQFPDGKFAQEAKLGISLQDKFAAIRDKKSKSGATIPFDVLGQRWQSWTTMDPHKGVIGYFAEKGENFASLGWFSPLTGGSTPGGNSVSFDGSGVMVSPTGHGSIIGFRTDGLKYEWLGAVVCQGNGDEPMFFGVLGGTGLVHLTGAGKVTLPDGKTFDVK